MLSLLLCSLYITDCRPAQSSNTIVKFAEDTTVVGLITGVLRESNICEKLLVTAGSTIKSILTYCITVWFYHCTEADRRRLQRVVKTAQRIIGCPLPSLRDIHPSRCLSRAEAIIRDSTHPAHHLFDLLPSGRRYRSIRTRTDRLRNSFFPQAHHGTEHKRALTHTHKDNVQ